MDEEQLQPYLHKLPDYHRVNLGKNLCVCNDVPKLKVLAAIIQGAKSVEEVKKQTYATEGNACCRSNIERLIEYLHAPD